MLEKGPVMVQYHFYSFKMVTEKCNIAGVGLNPRNVHLKLVSTSRQWFFENAEVIPKNIV